MTVIRISFSLVLENSYESLSSYKFSTCHFLGFKSWCRVEESDSWYISSLCDVFQEYAYCTELTEMLSEVLQRVSAILVMKEKKPVEEFVTYASRLTKKLYFNPRKSFEEFGPEHQLLLEDPNTNKNKIEREYISLNKMQIVSVLYFLTDVFIKC